MMNLVIINPIHLVISFFVSVIKALKNNDLILFWSARLSTDTNLILTDKLELEELS